jgi:hypothetical protein
MASRVYLTASISAVLDDPERDQSHVTLPQGAILQPTSSPSTTHRGMFGVYWEGRRYEVSLSELLLKSNLSSMPEYRPTTLWKSAKNA